MKISQREKDRDYMISLVDSCGIKNNNKQKPNSQKQREWWLPGSGGWGNGERVVKGYSFKMKTFGDRMVGVALPS